MLSRQSAINPDASNFMLYCIQDFPERGDHMLKEQEEALIAQQAAEFQAWLKSQTWWPLQPKQAGHSGPLIDVFLPPEQVDEMEAAIEEAFEQVTVDDDSSF